MSERTDRMYVFLHTMDGNYGDNMDALYYWGYIDAQERHVPYNWDDHKIGEEALAVYKQGFEDGLGDMNDSG